MPRFPALIGVILAIVPAQLHPAESAEQYKRPSRQQITRIVDGQTQAAVEHYEKYLAENPGDPESLYGLAVAYCQLGQVDKALEFVRRAVAAGMPLERFVAGPRNLLRSLAENETFREMVRRDGHPLLHGPMVGSTTDRGASFWVRTGNETPVQVLVSESAELADPIRSEVVASDSKRDYTAVIRVDDLRPNTTYTYDVLLDGRSVLTTPLPSFRTFPPQGQHAHWTIGFGGGAGYTPWKERMWDTIDSHDLLAFLFLGDNVYIDVPTQAESQRYCYYRRQSRAEYRRFVESTSIFAVWDDHDFCTNDGRGGPAIDDPPWKIPVWRVFRENWVNPAYGGGAKQPGCWFRFSLGDVDFFMLDSRYYREDPRRENPSMLGPAQKAWLLAELERSEATFKVIASPVPWVLDAKGASRDTWRGYQAEREEIFSFLAERRTDGVVLLSADRHRSDYWRIDRPGAYPLYEFESSRLTNIHVHPIMPGSLFGYNEKCSFGELEFDTTMADPELTYRIVNIDDELIHSFTLRKSQLSSQ